MKNTLSKQLRWLLAQCGTELFQTCRKSNPQNTDKFNLDIKVITEFSTNQNE